MDNLLTFFMGFGLAAVILGIRQVFCVSKPKAMDFQIRKIEVECEDPDRFFRSFLRCVRMRGGPGSRNPDEFVN